MRYRKLDANGDMVFGGDQAAFWVNVPDAVGQAIGTRLRLNYGEWFLDITDGTNWATGVLGTQTQATRDMILKARILATQGVTQLLQFAPSFDGNARKYTVVAAVNTEYGVTQVQETL